LIFYINFFHDNINDNVFFPSEQGKMRYITTNDSSRTRRAKENHPKEDTMLVHICINNEHHNKKEETQKQKNYILAPIQDKGLSHPS